jgi:glutamine synthetase adenylyltransferase
MRSLLFELLVANPRLLELLVKTFDASPHATDLLIRRPPLLEEVTRPGVLDRSVSVERHLTALRATDAAAGKLDPVRAYRQTQSLRILLRDILGLLDLPALHREQSGTRGSVPRSRASSHGRRRRSHHRRAREVRRSRIELRR